MENVNPTPTDNAPAPSVEPTPTPAPATPTPSDNMIDAIATPNVPTLDGDGNEVVEMIYAEKYKSVGELEKGYKELQSAFSKKMGNFTGAPEGDYSLEGDELSGSEKGMVDMLSAWGKENNLSQAGFEGLISQYSENQSKAKQEAIQVELGKLGENATTRLKDTTDFLHANLGEEATAELAKHMNTASSIESIEKLIAMTKAPKPSNTPSAITSPEQISAMRFAKDEFGVRKMEDPNYRKRVLQLEAQK